MSKIYEVAIKLAGQLSGGFVRSFSQASSAVRNLGTDLDRLKTKEEKLFKARQNLQKNLSGLSKNAPYATGAGVALGAGLSTSVSTGMDFEAQISKVGAISRASAEDMAKLEAKARELGAATSWSATQAAEGMQYLSMAGFSTDQILKAMPGMLSLASAGAVDLGQAADIASNILSGFNMQASEMGLVGDVLVNTFTKSNTSLESLGVTMKYAAPIAVAYGLGIEQVAAMAAKLGDAGIQGSDAGTALRSMMVRLSKPTKETAEALAALGVELKKNGKMKDMATILAEIAKAEEKLSEAGRLRANATIFGTEALSAASVLMKQSVNGELQKFEQAVKAAGSSEEVAGRQLDNLKGDVTKLGSGLQELQLIIYGTIQPALRDLASWTTDIVTKVQGWCRENPALTKTITLAAVAIATATAAALPMVAAFRTMAFVVGAAKLPFSILGTVTGKLGIGISGLSGTMGSFAAAGGPLLLAAAGIYTLYRNSEDFRTVCDGIIGGVTKLGAELGGKLGGVLKEICEWLGKAIDGFMKLIGLGDTAKGVKNASESFERRQGIDLSTATAEEIAQAAAEDRVGMASGGIVTGPTRALIGEGREAEAVLPLSRLSSMLRGGTGAAGMNVTFSPTINVSGGADAYDQVKRGITEGRDALRRDLEKLMNDRRRLSYV